MLGIFEIFSKLRLLKFPWNQNERDRHLLIVDVFRFHPAVELGQPHSQYHTGQQEEGGTSQPEPEGVLKHNTTTTTTTISVPTTTL